MNSQPQDTGSGPTQALSSVFPGDLSHYREALALIEGVRTELKEREKQIKGKYGQGKEEREDAIRTSFQNKALIQAANENIPAKQQDTIKAKLLMFEKICKRLQMEVPEDLWPIIHGILITQNMANANMLQMRPDKTMSYTIYNGVPSPCLKNDPRFAGLSQTIITRAVEHNPTVSEAFLLKGMEDYETLCADERFADIPDHLISHVVFTTPRDPIQTMVDRVQKRNELLNDPEYRHLPEFVIERAVFYYPQSVEDYLDNGLEKCRELAQNPKFSALKPWMIARAVFLHPSNKIGYLNDSMKRVEDLMRRPEAAGLPRSLIETVAFLNPDEPEAALQRNIDKTAELQADPEFEHVQASIIQHAAFNSPSRPHRRLRKFMRGEISLNGRKYKGPAPSEEAGPEGP